MCGNKYSGFYAKTGICSEGETTEIGGRICKNYNNGEMQGCAWSHLHITLRGYVVSLDQVGRKDGFCVTVNPDCYC